MYPIAESFRLCIQVMSLPQFPLNVLGSVLARNRTEVFRPLAPGDKLTYRLRHGGGFGRYLNSTSPQRDVPYHTITITCTGAQWTLSSA